MRITISSDIDTIHLEGAPRIPDHVWGIVKDGIDGWFGTPSPHGDFTDIPQQDGAYMPAFMRQGTRVVTVRGFIKNVTSVEAVETRKRLCNLACRKLTLRVEDSDGVKEAQCYMTADPEPLMSFREQAFAFSLILTCPDPLKYGAEAVFGPVGSGTLTVSNDGLAASWPRVRVDGRVSGLRLSCGDGVVEWRGDVDGLDLDFRDMLPGSGIVSVNRPWRVPPGVSMVNVTVSQDARVSMMVRPAWR